MEEKLAIVQNENVRLRTINQNLKER